MWRQLQVVVYFDKFCNTFITFFNTGLAIEAEFVV